MTYTIRRIPGVVALAVTNLVAAWSWFDDASFRTSVLFEPLRNLAPLGVWAVAWTLAGAGLLASVVRRSLTILHLFGGLSFTIWAAVVAGTMVQHVVGTVHLSPIALALYAWLLLGQASMLLAPMWRPHL